VVADGTCSQGWQRELLTESARRSGALRFFLELTAPPQQVQERMDRRPRDASTESDADWSIHVAQAARWEPMTLPDWDHPVVTTDSGVEDVVRRVAHEISVRLERLPAKRPPSCAASG
jgi:predicted kinase